MNDNGNLRLGVLRARGVIWNERSVQVREQAKARRHKDIETDEECACRIAVLERVAEAILLEAEGGTTK